MLHAHSHFRHPIQRLRSVSIPIWSSEVLCVDASTANGNPANVEQVAHADLRNILRDIVILIVSSLLLKCRNHRAVALEWP